MATFRKRGKSIRVEVSKKGIRQSATFDTITQAREWAALTESTIIESKSTDIVSNKTVSDAFERYAEEVSPNKKGARWEIIRLNALQKYPLASVLLSDLTAIDLASWRDQRLREVSAASVNRELNIISSVFTVARTEWRWITNNPVSDIRRPPNPKSRDRRISDEEIQRVLDALGYSEGDAIEQKKQLVALYFLIAIETAMRLGELCMLTGKDIHLTERYVTLRDTKNNDSRQVPLSKRAVELFQFATETNLQVVSSVASSLFLKACRQTQIENLHFHDTRHEALTRLARKLEMLDLARMVGHRDPRSLMIYYNPTATEIASRLD
jgi:integrase